MEICSGNTRQPSYSRSKISDDGNLIDSLLNQSRFEREKLGKVVASRSNVLEECAEEERGDRRLVSIL